MYAARSEIGLMSKRLIPATLILVVCLCLWGIPARAAIIRRQLYEPVRSRSSKYSGSTLKTPGNEGSRFERPSRDTLTFLRDIQARRGIAMAQSVPEKQQEFTREFTKLLFNTYVGDLEKYARQDITYRSRELYKGYVVVEANAGGQTVEYYLHLIDGNWKVYDLGVGGMSLVTNYRDQFDPILTNGSFDQLSMVLKRKIDQVCALGRC